MKREIWSKRDKHYKNSLELFSMLSGRNLKKSSVQKIREVQDKEYKKYLFIKGIQKAIDKQKESNH
ncbi:MAG: hypothetical protein ACI4VQ_01335 [Clostridia bacterium]